MGAEIMLVSGKRVTLAVLQELFADPGVRSALGDATLAGSPEEHPRVTRVDTERLSLVLHGPQESRTGGGVAAYTTDLGVARPTDADGSTWWTRFEIARGAEDEAAVHVLSAVLAALAAASSGHVVVEGELVELDGVDPPAPAEAVASAPAPDLGTGRAYLTALLPGAPPDEAGWRQLLRVVHALTADVPELWPGSVQVDGEWRPFTATDPPPPWWPSAQWLASAEPAATWELAVAGTPGQTLSQISLTATVDAATTGRLLLALAALDVGYAFLHHWTPAETLPSDTTGLRHDDPDDPADVPWVLLTEEDLAAGLPGVYWAQLIGPELEAVIGRDRLAGTPAHRVEEVAPHRWLIQLTPSAADVVHDLPHVLEVQQRVRDHLRVE
ncbi:hypothetical protein [Nocardioides sp. W7]|uniref:hypothetical protein n=1 Tax=Nocardioides sp. W7 TaxID=2931390 RepID=UPI001FD15B4F|nr:hypothetical protein [Nocardioides sp. W7]